MTTADTDELVDSYLERLDTALAGVPRARRAEIVEEISNHIADERARLTGESEADVLNILERLGEPAEVAAAAGGEAPQPSPMRRAGPVEVLALVLTPVVWPLGVIMLWLSPAWTTRDKVIGTLLPPGGLWLVLLLPLIGWFGITSCSSGSVGDQVVYNTCPSALQQTIGGILFAAMALMLFALPVLSGIYLGWRLRQWTQAA